MKIRILSIVLLLVLLLTACQNSGITNGTLNGTEMDTSLVERRTAYADFTLNKIFVQMTNDASLQFIDYTPEHFSEIKCISVKALNEESKQKAQAALRGEKVEEYEPSEYYAYLLLQIEDTGPEGIYRAMTMLDNREDVIWMSANIFGSLPVEPNGPERTPEEEWGYRDFSNNAIIVELTNEASLQFLEYTPEDFSEIGCVKVVEWSPFWLNAVQKKMRGESVDLDFHEGNYFRRLVLYLEDQTRDNVFQALATIEQREDIARARPNLT